MNADAVLIAGPTASGKSAAALALAERVHGAVINADSMQVYREARILTARPSDAEMARRPHLLYGHVSVREPYSVALYLADAAAALARARASGRLPIFVGGTGLYFHSMTHGLSDIPAIPIAVRGAVAARRRALGPEAFFVVLTARDPGTAARLRASDTQRVLRACEVLEATGRPLADWQREASAALLSELRIARFVLSPPRPELYRRIDARFDAMVAAGAMEEAAALGNLDPALPSAKILGLRELQAAAKNETTLATAVDAAKMATRQYAKRQLTWFRRRMADWLWPQSQELDDIVRAILSQMA